MSYPKHYISGLSKSDTKIQQKALLKARKMYNKNVYVSRPKLKSFKSKQSRHIRDFHRKYNINISRKTLPDISKVTGIPVSALQKVISKGEGAYYSSGSRPNQTAQSWAYARLASFLLGRGAYKTDKSVLDNVDKSKIKIKLPKDSPKQQGGAKKRIPDCCSVKITGKETGVCKTKKRTYNLPRRFRKNKCSPKKVKGFTMRSSCAPFRECF